MEKYLYSVNDDGSFSLVFKGTTAEAYLLMRRLSVHKPQGVRRYTVNSLGPRKLTALRRKFGQTAPVYA